MNKWKTRSPPTRWRSSAVAGDLSRYVSNHAFNQSAELKPHVFSSWASSLDVAERRRGCS